MNEDGAPCDFADGKTGGIKVGEWSKPPLSKYCA